MRSLITAMMLFGVTAQMPGQSGQPTSDWKGDGNSLLRYCSVYVSAADNERVVSAREAADGTFCTGYLLGIGDFDFMLSQIERERGGGKSIIQHICIPEGVSTGQTVRIVVKWLRENPDKLHMPASVLAVAAIRNSFPCKSG